MLIREGFPDCDNYLDDFCVVGRDLESCCRAQWALVHILGRVGFHVSFKKLMPAGCVTKCLGIEIDSDKLCKLLVQLTIFLKKRKASRQELETLGGILVHCCKVVHRGEDSHTEYMTR